MKKIWTQIKHYLKRDKGSYISFGVIVLFTAFLLNLALVLCFQVDSAYDEKFEALHTANINFCIPKSQDTEELADELMAVSGRAGHNGSCLYGGGCEGIQGYGFFHEYSLLQYSS